MKSKNSKNIFFPCFLKSDNLENVLPDCWKMKAHFYIKRVLEIKKQKTKNKVFN